jgi:hypothetical protein
VRCKDTIWSPIMYSSGCEHRAKREPARILFKRYISEPTCTRWVARTDWGRPADCVNADDGSLSTIFCRYRHSRVASTLRPRLGQDKPQREELEKPAFGRVPADTYVVSLKMPAPHLLSPKSRGITFTTSSKQRRRFRETLRENAAPFANGNRIS